MRKAEIRMLCHEDDKEISTQKKKNNPKSNQTKQSGNQPCTKYSHISTKPIRLHRMLPSSASPMYTSPFQHHSKGKKKKEKLCKHRSSSLSTPDGIDRLKISRI